MRRPRGMKFRQAVLHAAENTRASMIVWYWILSIDKSRIISIEGCACVVEQALEGQRRTLFSEAAAEVGASSSQ